MKNFIEAVLSREGNGARGGNRTHTPLREVDFESTASANSATRAQGLSNSEMGESVQSENFGK